MHALSGFQAMKFLYKIIGGNSCWLRESAEEIEFTGDINSLKHFMLIKLIKKVVQTKLILILKLKIDQESSQLVGKSPETRILIHERKCLNEDDRLLNPTRLTPRVPGRNKTLA